MCKPVCKLSVIINPPTCQEKLQIKNFRLATSNFVLIQTKLLRNIVLRLVNSQGCTRIFTLPLNMFEILVEKPGHFAQNISKFSVEIRQNSFAFFLQSCSSILTHSTWHQSFLFCASFCQHLIMPLLQPFSKSSPLFHQHQPEPPSQKISV